MKMTWINANYTDKLLTSPRIPPIRYSFHWFNWCSKFPRKRRSQQFNFGEAFDNCKNAFGRRL